MAVALHAKIKKVPVEGCKPKSNPTEPKEKRKVKKEPQKFFEVFEEMLYLKSELRIKI